MPENAVLQFENVGKEYPSPGGGGSSFVALEGVSFEIRKGDFAALIGPSGSGKTSLLNIAAGLDFPTAGTVKISGRATSQMTPAELSRFRRDHLGFVFQAYNLFPVLSAIENVEYTRLIRGDDRKTARARASEALAEVGLADKMHSAPSKLSGGQQQRVAVARALASDPDLIFADEPTANLDSKTALQLIELFKKLNEDKKITFLFSTHDLRLLESVKTAIAMKDGKIQDIQTTHR